ncbi:hypothetical protein BDB01DRAFT_773850 [Pilobolus umbonatus]|nr:hypothetical protein BDB01DRAFT_773850 [Pilobolus umbonatus]
MLILPTHYYNIHEHVICRQSSVGAGLMIVPILSSFTQSTLWFKQPLSISPFCLSASLLG